MSINSDSSYLLNILCSVWQINLWDLFNCIIRKDREGEGGEKRGGKGGEAVGAAHLYRQPERRETEQHGDEDRGGRNGGIDIGTGK